MNLTAQSKVGLGGQPVYSAVFDSHCDVGSGRSCDGMQAGYSNRTAQDTAVGDEPQTVYALFDGRHYNTGCCFEFGNAEKNATRLSGSMEAASVLVPALTGDARRRRALRARLREGRGSRRGSSFPFPRLEQNLIRLSIPPTPLPSFPALR